MEDLNNRPQSESKPESSPTAGEANAPASQEETPRLKVLRLLEQGKITPGEARDLLSALRRDDALPPGPRAPWSGSGGSHDGHWPGWQPRWLRVRVTDQASGEVKANFSIPLGVLGMGFGLARRWSRRGGRLDDLMEAVRSGKRGNVFDVAGHSGERVEISID